MSSASEFRLYTFVAGLYLSPLQRGLQTAHVVSEIANKAMDAVDNNDATDLRLARDFRAWAEVDKTIIICEAGNHKGVLDCWAELKRTGIDPGFVTGAIFFEDEQSMNGMATACGVIVPKKYWDVQYFEGGITRDQDGQVVKHTPAYWEHPYTGPAGELLQQRYDLNYPEGQFISHIKKYRLTSS